MNNDGFGDLMYFQEHIFPSMSANAAVAYSGNTTPYFGNNVDLHGSNIPAFLGNFRNEIVRGDVNNDGKEDIIAFDRSMGLNKLFIVIDPFNINNNFEVQKMEVTAINIKKNGNGIILADLNNDQLPELVSIGLDDVLRVFHNNNDRLSTSDNMISQSGFTVFPNPANEMLTIEGIKKSSIASISIHNMAGQLVKKINKKQNQVHLSGISTGTYIISIETKDGQNLSKSFIKK